MRCAALVLGAVLATSDGSEVDRLLALHCQACHSLGYVSLQRQAPEQWRATLEKMRAWGATLSESEIPLLARALASRHGPSAPLPAPSVAVVAPVEEHAPPRAPGAVRQGRSLFAARCAGCHGSDASGGLGVNLVDTAWLDTPWRFNRAVRNGRGQMPAFPQSSDAELDALRAWLRGR